MIKPVSNIDYNAKYNVIKCSGYTAMAGVGLATVTGIKKVKIPHKFACHTIAATVAFISMLVHIGEIKHCNKAFYQK